MRVLVNHGLEHQVYIIRGGVGREPGGGGTAHTREGEGEGGKGKERRKEKEGREEKNRRM